MGAGLELGARGTGGVQRPLSGVAGVGPVEACTAAGTILPLGVARACPDTSRSRWRDRIRPRSARPPTGHRAGRCKAAGSTTHTQCRCGQPRSCIGPSDGCTRPGHGMTRGKRGAPGRPRRDSPCVPGRCAEWSPAARRSTRRRAGPRPGRNARGSPPEHQPRGERPTGASAGRARKDARWRRSQPSGRRTGRQPRPATQSPPRGGWHPTC